MDRFGLRLRLLRTQHQLGQTDVAAEALKDVDPTPEQIRDFANYLSRIESEKVKDPGLERTELIAKGLGLSLAQFFTEIERLTVPATMSVNMSGSADAVVAGVSGGTDAGRVSLPSAERFERAVVLLEAIAGQLAVVNQDINERLSGFILAPAAEQSATAHRVLKRDRLSRESVNKARRKTR